MNSPTTSAVPAQAQVADKQQPIALPIVFGLAAIALTSVSVILAATYAASRATDPVSAYLWGTVGATLALALAISPSEAAHALARRLYGRATAALVLSIIAALFVIAGALGNASAGRAAVSNHEHVARSARGHAQQAHDRAAAELAGMTASRLPGEIQPQLAALDARIGRASCSDWVPNVDARAACLAKAKLQAELARANRRATLEADIADAAAALAAPVAAPIANADAKSIARYLAAMGIATTVETVADWLTILSVLGIEFGAPLALALARGGMRPAHGSTHDTASDATDSRSGGIATELPPAPQPGIAPKSLITIAIPSISCVAASSRHDRNAAIIARLKAGALAGRQKDIAATLGMPLTTLRHAVQRDGRLRLSVGVDGSRLELVGA